MRRVLPPAEATELILQAGLDIGQHVLSGSSSSILLGGCTTSKLVASHPFNFLKPSPTHQQLTRLQGKVEGMVEAMVEWQGFRLETRVRPNGCSWEMFEQQVDGGAAELISNTMGVEVRKGLILHSAQRSLHALDSLGLCDCSSQQRQQRIPASKPSAYQRLLHKLGLTRKFTHWQCFKADQALEPWRPVRGERISGNFGVQLCFASRRPYHQGRP